MYGAGESFSWLQRDQSWCNLKTRRDHKQAATLFETQKAH
jgi:hypothetical protein